jgi:hypothetical protein
MIGDKVVVSAIGLLGDSASQRMRTPGALGVSYHCRRRARIHHRLDVLLEAPAARVGSRAACLRIELLHNRSGIEHGCESRLGGSCFSRAVCRTHLDWSLYIGAIITCVCAAPRTLPRGARCAVCCRVGRQQVLNLPRVCVGGSFEQPPLTSGRLSHSSAAGAPPRAKASLR